MRNFSFGVFPLFLLASVAGNAAEKEDWISGYNSFLFRSSSDRIFSGTDVRSESKRDREEFYDYLTIQHLKIYDTKDWRIWASASAWFRQDFGDKTYGTRGRGDLSFGSIQIDGGRTSDGFFRMGRIYNYQGNLRERFDGGEIFYPFGNGLEMDLFGGRRPLSFVSAGDDNDWLSGGRIGWRWTRRNTIGFSWLLSQAERQWDDQKIGGDWLFTPWRWLEIAGHWGYDNLSSELYEIQTNIRARVTHDFDLRLEYEDIVPGLMIPKSSIFSVYSLADEERISAQAIYHPGEKWSFLGTVTHIDYHNSGGMGGPNNYFTALNALEGGYQWRFGVEINYRHNPNDEISLRLEKLLEAQYGYTVTDLIRSNFDFRNYDLYNPPPSDEGFAFGRVENGFGSIGLSHWHQWSKQFTHSLDFSYYGYNNPLFLHKKGSDSYAAGLTLAYKFNPRMNLSIGGRYLSSLAESDATEFYVRWTNSF